MLKVILLSCLFFACNVLAEGNVLVESNVLAESVEQLKVKAAQGDIIAQSQLGLMYDTGDVVVQDYKEAVKWYRLAAEQGYLIAQYNLGVMYYNGQGVVQDYIIAHMWFCIAAANGYENAFESRDLTAKKMSSEDVSKAQGLARAWVSVHP